MFCWTSLLLFLTIWYLLTVDYMIIILFARAKSTIITITLNHQTYVRGLHHHSLTAPQENSRQRIHQPVGRAGDRQPERSYRRASGLLSSVG
jgi:hypothetical protein